MPTSCALSHHKENDVSVGQLEARGAVLGLPALGGLVCFRLAATASPAAVVPQAIAQAQAERQQGQEDRPGNWDGEGWVGSDGECCIMPACMMDRQAHRVGGRGTSAIRPTEGGRHGCRAHACVTDKHGVRARVLPGP